jgi:hypothetical protein
MVGARREEGVFQKTLTEELGALTLESTDGLRRPQSRSPVLC